MFILEIKKEKKLDPKDPEDITVDEAINAIYPSYSDYEFFLNFHDFSIPLTLRGDLSEIYNDIIKLHQNILSEQGQFTISFLSSTFTAIWDIELNGENVLIKPRWTTVGFIRNDEPILNVNYRNFEDIITIDKTLFISEWEKLLIEVREDLKRVGYGRELEGFEYLESLPSIKPEV